ncbi:phosphatase PAP2 family protein [Saccharopolyspora sp. HNM0983]|uniref:Phosphatase PAP2 family protein n=2 Tax=Saccharopolyspora montiporae TaxID=2781240 RepID=A0A929FY02_9PSEU|nr:phosphatase PAP2 family protein [Saccharopolyspora sp. HNM0983]
MWKAVDRLDRGLVQRSALFPASRADPAWKALTRLADHSKLWCATASVFALRKGPARRGAVRGLAAVAATSAVTNLLAKPTFPRRRPATYLLSPRRRLADPPRSSSFPSGHAASAAAFTTAVAMESPVLGVLVAPVAAGVAYSRVHVGAHWPSDVATGALLGAAVGLATQRWWPVRPAKPGVARPSEAVCRIDDGDGLALLVNPLSGAAGHDPLPAVADQWPKAALLRPNPEKDLGEQLDTMLGTRGDGIRALGVAGGDGTVGTAAAVAAERGLPLVVVPTGTLNHFARDVGVHTAEQAARALTEGTAVHVDLGTVEVDGGPPRWFVNTAGIGGYPDVVRLRQRWEPRLGKWPAAVLALVRVLARARPLRMRLDGTEVLMWGMFVGSGGFEPKGFTPSWRPRLDDGILDVRYVRADLHWSRTRFVLSVLSGTLARSRTYVQQDREVLDVRLLCEPQPLACDGEVRLHGRTFRFVARDEALRVYRPRDATGRLA